MSDTVEVIGQKEPPWETKVYEWFKNMCCNCGGTDRLRASLIVPEEAGGRKVMSNSTLLCRTCEMASEVSKSGDRHSDRRLVNFWVSRPLYQWMHEDSEFDSMGKLIRYLMTKYVQAPDRFDDLEQYQENGADVKVNVWVDRDNYAVFKALVEQRGMTVTDTFKALLLVYRDEQQGR